MARARAASAWAEEIAAAIVSGKARGAEASDSPIKVKLSAGSCELRMVGGARDFNFGALGSGPFAEAASERSEVSPPARMDRPRVRAHCWYDHGTNVEHRNAVRTAPGGIDMGLSLVCE